MAVVQYWYTYLMKDAIIGIHPYYHENCGRVMEQWDRSRFPLSGLVNYYLLGVLSKSNIHSGDNEADREWMFDVRTKIMAKKYWCFGIRDLLLGENMYH